jgi:hypothetical protein
VLFDKIVGPEYSVLNPLVKLYVIYKVTILFDIVRIDKKVFL